MKKDNGLTVVIGKPGSLGSTEGDSQKQTIALAVAQTPEAWPPPLEIRSASVMGDHSLPRVLWGPRILI